MRERVHRVALLATIGLGVFLVVAVGGLWMRGWFH